MNQPHLTTERCPHCGADVRSQSNHNPGAWDATEERSFRCGHTVRWQNRERNKGEEAWIQCPNAADERVRRDNYDEVARLMTEELKTFVKRGRISRADARYMFSNGIAATPWWGDFGRKRLENPFEDE